VEAVSGADDSEADAFTRAEHATVEYFRSEVLDSFDDATVEFLTQTSVLDELTGSLCDAVTGRSYSLRALERLERANAFVVALDARHRRYRYHALFRAFLRDELSRREADTVASLHRRASAWYGQHGGGDQAIRHAVAGGDTETAARLVWSETGACIGRGRSAALRETLNALTEEQLAGHPLLALAAAAADLTEGHADDAAHWLWLTEHAPGGGPSEPDAVRDGHVALLRSLLGEEGVARVEVDVDRSLDHDDERSPWRALGGFYCGLIRHLDADLDGARARLEEAAVRSAVLWPAIHAAATAELSLLDADAGRWDDAAARADRALRYVEERRLGDYPLVAIVPAVGAVNAVHRGDAGRARQQVAHSERLVNALGRVAPALRAEVRATLAWTSLQLGDTTRVRQHLRDVRPLLAAMPDARELHERVAALDADVQAITDTIVGPLALTVAERRVLAYLPMHLSLSEIAKRLYVSRNTVKSQAIAIYRKLAVSSRGAAVARAQDLGLLEE
jgi:LuxR family maltose regulon positive regulatory protein